MTYIFVGLFSIFYKIQKKAPKDDYLFMQLDTSNPGKFRRRQNASKNMEKTMQIDRFELLSAAAKLGIAEKTAEELWKALSEKPERQVFSFELLRLFYYFGTMIVIVALLWFGGSVWERFEGKGLSIISLAYMALFITIGNALWHKEGLKVPGGLFITLTVCLIPLAIFGFQKWTGWWTFEEPWHYKQFFHWINSCWFVMEAATIIGGCIALKLYRFPFLTAPIVFALWFISMDIASLVVVNLKITEDAWNFREWVSLNFGLILLIVAYVTDLRTREDFAFWGYFFGIIAFWIPLTLLGFGSFFYLVINVGLVLLSVPLQRSMFLVFGAIGVLVYVIGIYDKYFSDSIWFPAVLSLTGLIVIFIGIAYHKNRQKIDSFILNLFPISMQKWLPRPKKRL